MAVYSRTQTSGNTVTQSAPQLKSVDISNVVIKSLETAKEVLKEDENEDEDLENLEKTISDAIDNSKVIEKLEKKLDEKESKPVTPKNQTAAKTEYGKLLKSQTKPANLSSLLVAKQNKFTGGTGAKAAPKTPKSTLSSLLTKSINKDSSKTVSKQEKDKSSSMMGKVLSHMGPIGKGIGAIGKTVSTIASFSGLIVKNLGKVALIVALGTQLLVLLKAAWNHIKLSFPIWMADLKASIVGAIGTIPDKIHLMLQKTLQGTTLGSMMGFGGLSKEEKEEKKSLTKADANVKTYSKAESSRLHIAENLAKSAGLNVEDYDLNTVEGVAKLQGDVGKFIQGTSFEQGEKNAQYRQVAADISKIQELTYKMKEAEDSATGVSAENLTRYKELSAREKVSKMTPEQYKEEQAKINTKAKVLHDQSMTEQVAEWASKGIHTTDYQLQEAAKHGANIEQAKVMVQQSGKEWQAGGTANEEKAAHWMTHEFKEWKDSWAQFGKNLSQNIGVKITQKNTEQNALRCNR